MNVLGASVANMRGTYSLLGRTVAGVREIDHPRFKAMTGPFAHSICNFAIDLQLDMPTIADLKRIATQCPRFVVYLTDADQPEFAEELLVRAGFKAEFSLDILAASGKAPHRTTTIHRAETIGDRHRMVEFMATQFFTRCDRATRNQLIASTTLADDLDIWAVENAEIFASFMTFADDATIGLYNLCVASHHRGRGVGGDVVCTFLARCEAAGKIATLQCRSEITGWYTRFGFEKLGIVQGFSHSSHDAVIIS